MKHTNLIIGAAILLVGSALVATRSSSVDHHKAKRPAAAHAQLAIVSTAARHDVNYAELDSRLQELMKRPYMVGLAVGVVENGRITFLHGYGETLAGSGDKVTPATVFRWASLSKGVAATTVVKLAEEGKVDLDAPISVYHTSLRLPDGAEQRASVIDLLSHRLGLYHNAFDPKLESGADPRMLRASLSTLSLICQPGTCWDYQNVAFDTASEIVANVTHESYQRAVQQMIFDPVGMSSASLTEAGIESAPSWARPHSTGGRPLPMSDNYYRIPAAGGVNSNIKDLALWMMAQMGEMPDVISPKVLAALHSRLVKTPIELSRVHMAGSDRHMTAWYGLGWRSYDYAGHVLVGHRGGIDGYRSLILFDPQKKSGVVALWNSNTNVPGALEFEVLDQMEHLPFEDWLHLGSEPSDVAAGDDSASDNGDSGGGLH